MTGTPREPARAGLNVVMFNVFGHLNMGDAMLVETLIDLIHANVHVASLHGIAFHVESQERWLPNIKWSQRVATKTVHYSLRGKIVQALTLPIALAIAASRCLFILRWLLPKRQREGLEALAEADLAISCPGGYFEDSNLAYLLNVMQVLLAIRLAKTVVLAPQSIGPIRSRLGRHAIKFILSRVTKAFVREQSSLQFLDTVNGGRQLNVEYSGDLAFWYGGANGIDSTAWKELGVDPDKPIVGMTVLDWAFPKAADPIASEDAYLHAVSRVIDRASADGYQVVIFNQVATDLKAIDKLVQINDKAIVDRRERHCATLANMIGRCRIFIGSRFHSCIFSLISGVPTGAIAYLPKTSGIMKDLGLSRYVRDIENVTPEILEGLYEDLLADRDALAEKVRVSVEAYRKNHATFLAYLADVGGRT